MGKRGADLILVVNEDQSLLEGLISNALDGIPTPLDWVYPALGVPDLDTAWKITLKTKETFTPNQTPIFDCAEIAAAVERVGWRNICLSDNPDSERRCFARSYMTFVARKAREAYKDGRLETFRPAAKNRGVA